MLRPVGPGYLEHMAICPAPTFYSYIFENEAVRSEKRTGLNTTPWYLPSSYVLILNGHRTTNATPLAQRQGALSKTTGGQPVIITLV